MEYYPVFILSYWSFYRSATALKSITSIFAMLLGTELAVKVRVIRMVMSSDNCNSIVKG